MPLSERELSDVRRRVLAMLLDTVQTFEQIRERAEQLFGDRADDVKAAIDEYLKDFITAPSNAGQIHPEAVIYATPREKFASAGLYGAQLNLKERQVTAGNRTLRERMQLVVGPPFRRAFRKWVDVINNFLGSLTAATGLGEALKELKDCLRDELPDD